MDQDIQSQLDRSRELLLELEKACDDDLQAENVSEKTRILTSEVLLKIRHLLDQALYSRLIHLIPSPTLLLSCMLRFGI